MIILYLKKINTNFKETIQKYLNIVNFGSLECPNCHSHDIIRWGFYERGIIYKDEDIPFNVLSNVIKIQRVRCKSCGKTHALLPNGLIPYKQITSELMILLLKHINEYSIEKTSDKFSISISSLKQYWYDFKNKHLPRLKTLVDKNINKALDKIDKYLDIQVKYINSFCRCFMQIKLGCINTMPLHEGAPT